MKKFVNVFYVALLAVLTISFVACSDDDDKSDSGNIVGTWKNTDILAQSLELTQYIKFDKSGKYYEVDIYFDDDIEVLCGSWSRSGNTVRITSDAGITAPARIQFQGSKKIIIEQIGIRQEFTRVSDSVIDKYLKDYQ